MPDRNADYDPRAYWQSVAEHIEGRDDANAVAGDDEPFYRFKRERFLRRFLDRLPVTGRSCLEVGCGPGGNLAELARAHPRRLVGADITPGMVTLARSRVPAAEVVAMPDATLPFADGEFDLVFSATVLHHNTDATMRPLLGEMARVCAHQLVLIEETARRRREKFSYVRRPVSEYAAQAATHGFRLESTDYLGEIVLKSVTSASRRLLNPRPVAEGAARSARSRRVETRLVRLLSGVDDRLAIPAGLTMMTFLRLGSEPLSALPAPR